MKQKLKYNEAIISKKNWPLKNNMVKKSLDKVIKKEQAKLTKLEMKRVFLIRIQ